MPVKAAFSQGQVAENLSTEVQVTEEVIENVSAEPPNDESQAKEGVTPVETLTGDPHIEDMVRRTQLSELDFIMTQIGSMFFTNFERNLIEQGRKGLISRAPTEAEVKESVEAQKEGKRPPMGPREIALGGIVYSSSTEWTIWLNGQKITPDRLPAEVFDIRVYKDHIKLKWFDAYTNQIFPVKIKTQQRFNIDTRIFLPG